MTLEMKLFIISLIFNLEGNYNVRRFSLDISLIWVAKHPRYSLLGSILKVEPGHSSLISDLFGKKQGQLKKHYLIERRLCHFFYVFLSLEAEMEEDVLM